jgi:hypothetical protein
LTTDKVTYGAQEEIRVDTVLKRADGFGSLAGLQLALNVAASGVSLGEKLEPILVLAPDERRQLSYFFSTNTAPPGLVAIDAQILSGLDIVTTCSSITNITSSTEAGFGLTGSITADPAVAVYGAEIVLSYNVENIGNTAFEPADLKILIVEPTSSNVVMMLSDSVPLNPGDTFDASQVVAVQALAVGDYLVILQGGTDSNLKLLSSTALSIQEPPNNPPEARCQNITVPTDHGGCIASASIDSGSSDPDGDPILLVQLPPGPYELGTTEVILSVTDEKGLHDQCTATVLVLDQEPPLVENIVVNQDLLWSENHEMVPVSLTVNASDNCDSEPICHIISVASNEPADGLGSGDLAPDWEITGDLSANLRAESYGTDDHREYTITLECIDNSVNSTNSDVSVPVQHDPGEQLEIGNFIQISKERVSRVEYNYTYQADITNSGQDVQNVTAIVTINSPYTTVVDDTLTFGDVTSGSTVTSSDTFTIRQNRLYPFDWADLEWEIQADIP